MTLGMGPFFDPTGMNGRIYVELLITLLHAKQALGLVVSEKKIFHVFPIRTMSDNHTPKAWPVWTPGALVI